MCLAVPMQVVAIKSNQIAIVNLGGIHKEISTALIDSVDIGDYVIIHVGFALTKLNETEARKTLELLSKIKE